MDIDKKYIDKIDKKLKLYIKDINTFKTTLRNHNAYIAGGFLLSAIAVDKFETNDLDIYVSALNFDSLIDTLNIIPNCDKLYFRNLADAEGNFYFEKYDTDKNCKFIIASEYDHSFFKKNNIKLKISINCSGSKFLKIDIMVINAGVPVLDVIKNFDLTCCQLWYNGSEFNGTHLADINKKKAYLNEGYASSLLNNNFFIKNRMEKYTDRGFTIEIPIHKYEIPEKEKSIKDIQKFVVKVVINYYIMYLHYLISLNRDRNIAIKYLNIFDNTDNRTIKCKKMCLLEIKLKKINNVIDKAIYLIYNTLLKYCNSFNSFSINELENNTILYFGTDYKFVLNTILKFFTDVITIVEDSSKINRMNKIIDKMKQILSKNTKPLTTFKNYVTSKYNLPFDKKIESCKINVIEIQDSIQEHLESDKNNICIIGITENNKVDSNAINFTNIDYLSIYLRDMNSNWFYKCNEDVIDIAYVKIPLISNIYVPYYELYDIIQNRNKCQILFYKSPITYIVNTFLYHPNNIEVTDKVVSADHCQNGSSITTFKLYKKSKY